MAKEPFEQITIDAFKLGVSSSGEKWCLAMIDTFLRFAWATPIQDQMTECQIQALMRTVCAVATPEMLIMDRHQAYTADTFKTWILNY